MKRCARYFFFHFPGTEETTSYIKKVIRCVPKGIGKHVHKTQKILY